MKNLFRLGFSLSLVSICGLTLAYITMADSGGNTTKTKPDERAEAIFPTIERLRPVHKMLGTPKPGEWLSQHDEPGQTFLQYIAARPVRPTKKRGTIYIQPIGNFSKEQKEVVSLTAEFMELFYSIPVKTLPDISDKAIPKNARRTHPTWGDRQFLSTYILHTLLPEKLPKDGCVVLGLTATDLWPGRGWNFVFGQASTRERVGVWSIYRNGDPAKNKKAFRSCLLRTLKTAVHETGHMFTIKHCISYECGMCGCNSQPESDARPLGFCPECMAKVCWATRVEPRPRMKKLADFCKKQGLKRDLEHYEKQLRLLDEDSVPPLQDK